MNTVTREPKSLKCKLGEMTALENKTNKGEHLSGQSEVRERQTFTGAGASRSAERSVAC